MKEFNTEAKQMKMLKVIPLETQLLAAEIDHFYGLYDSYAEVAERVRSEADKAANIFHIMMDIHQGNAETSVILEECIRCCDSCSLPKMSKRASELLQRLRSVQGCRAEAD